MTIDINKIAEDLAAAGGAAHSGGCDITPLDWTDTQTATARHAIAYDDMTVEADSPALYLYGQLDVAYNFCGDAEAIALRIVSGPTIPRAMLIHLVGADQVAEWESEAAMARRERECAP